MAKPDVTLQPSKATVTLAAANIYAAYVVSGQVENDSAQSWIKRSIREAIGIARTVDACARSDAELPSTETETPLPPTFE